jgi:hypothetical protein
MARTPLQQGQQSHRDDGKDAHTSIMTKTPLQQEQQCQLENSNDAIALMETLLLQIKGNSTIVTRAAMQARQQQGQLRIDNGNNAILVRPTIAMVMMAKMSPHQQ